MRPTLVAESTGTPREPWRTVARAGLLPAGAATIGVASRRAAAARPVAASSTRRATAGMLLPLARGPEARVCGVTAQGASACHGTLIGSAPRAGQARLEPHRRRWRRRRFRLEQRRRSDG